MKQLLKELSTLLNHFNLNKSVIEGLNMADLMQIKDYLVSMK